MRLLHRLHASTTPLEAAHLTWLAWWGAWVLIGAHLIPTYYTPLYSWATLLGVRGGVGMIPLTLAIIDGALAMRLGPRAHRARWIVNGVAVAWWLACVIAFSRSSVWHTSTPSYGVAAIVALSVALHTTERRRPGGRADTD